jgi:hypothetical protein
MEIKEISSLEEIKKYIFNSNLPLNLMEIIRPIKTVYYITITLEAIETIKKIKNKKLLILSLLHKANSNPKMLKLKLPYNTLQYLHDKNLLTTEIKNVIIELLDINNYFYYHLINSFDENQKYSFNDFTSILDYKLDSEISNFYQKIPMFLKNDIEESKFYKVFKENKYIMINNVLKFNSIKKLNKKSPYLKDNLETNRLLLIRKDMDNVTINFREICHKYIDIILDLYNPNNKNLFTDMISRKFHLHESIIHAFKSLEDAITNHNKKYTYSELFKLIRQNYNTVNHINECYYLLITIYSKLNIIKI